MVPSRASSMGKWKRQHLIVEPGERDPDAVASDLRAALATLDVRDVPHPERQVSVENERVYWDSGERLGGAWQAGGAITTDLEVPCEWLLGVYQHEVDMAGGARLYTWVDGGLELVDASQPHDHFTGTDAVRYFEREWGIDVEYDL